jgi:hypothetical protein
MAVLASQYRLVVAILFSIGVVGSLFVEFKIYPNKRLRTPALAKLTLGSLPACSRKCFERNDCLSYGFTAPTKDGLGNCNLNNKNSQTSELVEEVGYVYGEGIFAPVREGPENHPDGTNDPEERAQPVTTVFSGDDQGIGDVSTERKKYSGSLNTRDMISKINKETETSTPAFVAQRVDTITVDNELLSNDGSAQVDIDSRNSESASKTPKSATASHSAKDITRTDIMYSSKTWSWMTEGQALSPVPGEKKGAKTIPLVLVKTKNASTLSPAPGETEATTTLSLDTSHTTVEGS